MRDLDYMWWFKGTVRAIYVFRASGRDAAICEIGKNGGARFWRMIRKRLGPVGDMKVTISTGAQDGIGKTVEFSMDAFSERLTAKRLEGKVPWQPWVYQWMDQVEEWDERLRQKETDGPLDHDQILMEMRKGR